MGLDAFDIELAQASEQGSNMWANIRAGRFTASEIHRIMKPGSRDMTAEELKARPQAGKGSSAKKTYDYNAIAEDTWTYIYEKVAETLTGIPKMPIYSHAAEWGDSYEPYAAEYLTQKFGWEYEIVAFVPYTEHAGGSPDRKILNQKRGIEIKCPFNAKNQVDYLMFVDQFDIKRMKPEYYWQMQANLLFTGWDLMHFCAFDPRMKEEKHKIVHIEVTPVEEDQNALIKKLEIVIKEKLEILNLLK